MESNCIINRSSINYIFQNPDLNKNINSSLNLYNNPYFEFEIQRPYNWKVVDADTGVAFYSPSNNDSNVIKETFGVGIKPIDNTSQNDICKIFKTL